MKNDKCSNQEKKNQTYDKHLITIAMVLIQTLAQPGSYLCIGVSVFSVMCPACCSPAKTCLKWDLAPT